jgi:hypothetical protein
MKKFILLAAVVATAWQLQAQDKKTFRDRIYVGGGFGGQFGNQYTYIDVSPIVGYYITDRWSAGVGFTFQYFQSKLYDYSTSIYGPKAFTRYDFLTISSLHLFAHAEFEYLFLKYREDLMSEPTQVTSPNLLLGGGASYSLGGKASAYAMILYNVLQNKYTPYSNPVIRVGVNVGF